MYFYIKKLTMLFWHFKRSVSLSLRVTVHVSMWAKVTRGSQVSSSITASVFPKTWGTCFLKQAGGQQTPKDPPVPACFWTEVIEKYTELSACCLSAGTWTLSLMTAYQVLLSTELSIQTVLFADTGLVWPRLALNSLCSRVRWLVLIINLVSYKSLRNGSGACLWGIIYWWC